MQLSREARLISGLTLLTVPTIAFGGATLLGILTDGEAGIVPSDLELNETQWALFRAGHAHAGVWLIFSLVLQVLLDAATLSAGWKWLARLSAPIAAMAISGGVLWIGILSRLSLAAVLRGSVFGRRDARDWRRLVATAARGGVGRFILQKASHDDDPRWNCLCGADRDVPGSCRGCGGV